MEICRKNIIPERVKYRNEACRLAGTGHGAQGAGQRAQGAGHGAQGSEHRAQSIGYRLATSSTFVSFSHLVSQSFFLLVIYLEAGLPTEGTVS